VGGTGEGTSHTTNSRIAPSGVMFLKRVMSMAGMLAIMPTVKRICKESWAESFRPVFSSGNAPLGAVLFQPAKPAAPLKRTQQRAAAWAF